MFNLRIIPRTFADFRIETPDRNGITRSDLEDRDCENFLEEQVQTESYFFRGGSPLREGCKGRSNLNNDENSMPRRKKKNRTGCRTSIRNVNLHVHLLLHFSNFLILISFLAQFSSSSSVTTKIIFFPFFISFFFL